jgi:hypothetical protein
MLVITLSKLGLNYSSILSYVIVASSSPPTLPPISSKQVHSSFSFESFIDDPKIVLDFFLSGEVISLRFNMSFGVGDFMRIFNR